MTVGLQLFSLGTLYLLLIRTLLARQWVLQYSQVETDANLSLQLKTTTYFASQLWWRFLVTLVLGFSALLALRYLYVARPLIEGVDLFFFLVKARDRLSGLADSSDVLGNYFPGGYVFWQTILVMCGKNLATVQWTVVALLALNAVLVAAIVRQALRNWQPGLLAALWYLALASRLEGLYGTTEPIATVFALFGLLCWGGLPLQGAAGWWRVLFLGSGLGLALWVKQQGGLISLGALALLGGFAMTPLPTRHSILQITALPFIAALVFLAAILFEGHGLDPLLNGLTLVAQYDAQGVGLDNLSRVIAQMGVLGWWWLFACLFWGVTFIVPMLRKLHAEPWAQVAGFAVCASLATTVQFFTRPYLHYGLLLAPFVPIAAITIAIQLARKMPENKSGFRSSPHVLIGILLVLPLIAKRGETPFFHIWPVEANLRVAHETPWHLNPEIASDLLEIATRVDSGDPLLVLPPRRYVIHFMLGTRPTQDGWGSVVEDADVLSRLPTLASVLVIEQARLDPSDMTSCEVFQCASIISRLPDSGFEKTMELKTMTLWRRSL